MGLFFRLDAFLDKPLSAILSNIPISEDIKNALLGNNSLLGLVLKVVVFCEKGDWERVFLYLSDLKAVEKNLTPIFIETIIETDRILPVTDIPSVGPGVF